MKLSNLFLLLLGVLLFSCAEPSAPDSSGAIHHTYTDPSLQGNPNVPDQIYPYLTANPTLRRETVTIDGELWTYFVVTLPVTPNVRAATVAVGGIGLGTYSQVDEAISPVKGIITMTTKRVKTPLPATYVPAIILYTGNDPGRDFVKPLTFYMFNVNDLSLYARIRWRDYRPVDTTATNIPVPTVLLEYHDRTPIKPAS